MKFLLQLLNLIIDIIKFKYCSLSQNQFNNKIYNFIKNQGFVFIKLCQIITSQDHLKKKLGNELFSKLKLLQNKCYQNDYINYPDLLYLQQKPIASGSICQIFKIFYKNKYCALKQLIPNINNSFNESFQNLIFFKNLLYYFHYDYYQLIDCIDENEYNDYIMNQTKLDIEAKNMILFNDIFKDNSNIIIPNIYYYDKDRIIMSLEKGLKYDEFINIYPEFKEEAIFLFCSFIYKSILNNIIHGDLHYGNFSYKIINNKLHLIVYDFGIVYPISDVEKNSLSSLIENQEEQNDLLSKYLKDNYDLDSSKDVKNINDLKYHNFIKKIPLKFISLFSIGLFFKKKYKGSKTSFYIKLMNYIYKNNFNY